MCRENECNFLWQFENAFILIDKRGAWTEFLSLKDLMWILLMFNDFINV